MFTLALRPPPIAWSPALRWVLIRAFAAPEVPAPAVSNPDLVFPLAQQLNLDARIGARLSDKILEAELGKDVAQRFLLASFVCQTRNHHLLNQIRILEDLAQALGARLCLLKGGALVALGVARGRWVSDCDVLASPTDAERLFQALIARGWVPEPAPPPDHHLPQLTGPGCSIELHIALPALRENPRRAWVDFDALAARRLLAPARADFPPALLIPDRRVLAAHAIAHALRQHRFAPAAYPPFRLLADLADLGVESATLQAFFRATGLAPQLPQHEAEAVIGLAKSLTAGDAANWDSPGNVTLEGGLLAHFVAGALDPEYGRSLKFRAVFAKATNRHHVREHLRMLWRDVWLTDRQVMLIYGKQKSPWQVWAWRLFRPSDLVARSLRALCAALRIAQKRKSPTA